MHEKQIEHISLSVVETEIIGYMVSIAAVFRFPKSVGEIFGLLYIVREPLSMDKMMRTLSISLGTASQGIRTLRSFGAVRSVYIPGERKEHFIAETDFRKLLNRLILDDWKPKLDAATERLVAIETRMDASDVDPFLREKVRTLKRLNDRANLLYNPLSKIINYR